MNNSLLFIGRVEKDPKVFAQTQRGENLVRFAIAATEMQFVEARSFEVESSSEVAERVLSCLSKGRHISMHGKLALSTSSSSPNDGLIPVIRLHHFHVRDDCV